MKHLVFLFGAFVLLFTGCNKDSISSLKDKIDKYDNFSSFRGGIAKVHDKVQDIDVYIDTYGNEISINDSIWKELMQTDTTYNRKWILFNKNLGYNNGRYANSCFDNEDVEKIFGDGVTDYDGNILIKPQNGYRFGMMFSGLAMVKDSTGKFLGFIDINGKTTFLQDSDTFEFTPAPEQKVDAPSEIHPIRSNWTEIIGYDVNKVKEYNYQEGDGFYSWYFQKGMLTNVCFEGCKYYYKNGMLYKGNYYDWETDENKPRDFSCKQERNTYLLYSSGKLCNKLIYNQNGDLSIVLYKEMINNSLFAYAFTYDMPGDYVKDYCGNYVPAELSLYYQFSTANYLYPYLHEYKKKKDKFNELIYYYDDYDPAVTIKKIVPKSKQKAKQKKQNTRRYYY